MKQLLLRIIAYPTTGVGMYYTFFGDDNFYGFVILFMGLFGILIDLLYKKLGTD